MTYGNGAASRQGGNHGAKPQQPGGTCSGPRLVMTPAALGVIWLAGSRASRAGYAGEEGQRTVMTTDSVIASQEWSIPGPQMA